MALAPIDTHVRSRRSALWALARIIFGFALLALLYRWRVINLGALDILVARPDILALALAACLANIPLEALRWHVLLRAQGLDLRLRRTISVFTISLFFANLLPGAAGGDLIRGVYVYRAAPGKRAAAMLSILVDRLVGLVGFVLLGLIAILARPIVDGPIRLALIGLSLCFIAVLVQLFRRGHAIADRLRRLLSGRNARLAQLVDDTGVALQQYVQDRRSACLAMLMSLAIAGIAVVPIVLIAKAMAFGPTAGDYALAGLYALIANSVPATPGGLGIGEASFASVCLLLAPQAAHAAYGSIFLAFRCVFVLSTLPGLALVLQSRAISAPGKADRGIAARRPTR